MNKSQKFSILSEGFEYGVSETCRKYNISRTLYYRWLNRYKANGIEGLNDQKKVFTPNNKTSEHIEKTILDLVRTYPEYGPRAIKYLLEELNIKMSESAVFNVMKRHNLSNKQLRLKFSKQRKTSIVSRLPAFETINSGECLVFWITNYGTFDQVGSLYEYTLIDYKSKIACSRLYDDINFEYFEDILAAVAIPVIQTLNFNVSYLCLLNDDEIIRRMKKGFKSTLSHILERNSFDVKMHVLNTTQEIEAVQKLKSEYTGDCLSFLLPLIHDGLDFSELKVRFQHHVRDYNISPSLDKNRRAPVSYHISQTNSKLILPLWAYIERAY
jgi:transposase